MIMTCQEKNTCTGKTTKVESPNTNFVCERAERASDFWSFTVKKVNFFTINVITILSLSYLQKVGGGGGEYLYRPSPHPKKVGGYIPPPPIPPGFTPVIT